MAPAAAAAAAATHLISAMSSPRHIFSSVLVLQALLVAVIADSAKERPVLQRSNVCPVVLRQPPAATRITGGDPISPLLRPYVASLVTRIGPGVRLCTATPVTKRYLITAAHCAPAPGSSATTYARLTFDSVSPEDSFSQAVPVSRWITHPNFELNDDRVARLFDIAVVELVDDLEFERFDARTMPVNVADNIPLEASFARIAGFGRTASDGGSPPVKQLRLRQVDVPIISYEDCVEAFTKSHTVPTDEGYIICTGYLERGCEGGCGGEMGELYGRVRRALSPVYTRIYLRPLRIFEEKSTARTCGGCVGDSGGPLIQYDKSDNPVLIGVAVRGPRICGDPQPTVFIRTSKFRKWLDDQIEEDYVKATSVRPVFADNSTIDVSCSCEGLSGGAIAGIVIGVLVVVAAAGVALRCFFIRKRTFGKEDKVGGAAPPAPSTIPGVPVPYLQP